MNADATSAAPERVAFRTCPLCEATCGLEITVRGEDVVRVRGDRADVFSRGFICPKGASIRQLHHDPDRLRLPLVKRDGVHVEVSWDEAWEEVASRLAAFYARHGRAALGTYHGNPAAHSIGPMIFGRALSHGLGNTARFTASTVDQMPRQIASAMLYGDPGTAPVPDIDRTDLIVFLGANPMVSNGSLWVAPDVPRRLADLRARGGRVIVVDPLRTATADVADRWLAIRPGTDALLLAAMVTHLARSGRVSVGAHLAEHVDGIDTVIDAVASFTPESVAEATGLAAAEIESLAEEIAAADRAAVYGRIGTTTSAFAGQATGTVTSWLIDVVNALTGNLDRVGGSMFARPATGPADQPGRGRGFRPSGRTSRVGGAAVALGELPAAVMAEEIVTPGDEQIRGLLTVAGNPVLSTPNSEALAAALESLELMISVDIYLNETTRFADVILPPPSVLQRSHYDVALLSYASRNVANYSAPVFALEPGQPDEWQILAKLALIAQGGGGDSDPNVVEDLSLRMVLDAAVANPSSVVAGRDVDELLSLLDDQPGPERVLDVMLQLGPYGAGFGANPEGLSLAALRAAPHGIDLGPLQPRLPGMLRTPSGRVELANPLLLADLVRLEQMIAAGGATVSPTPPAQPGEGQESEHGGAPAVLVGRRHLRSNNSWMHNLPALVKGRPRCTLLVHPDDAAAWGLSDGGPAEVRSRVGQVTAIVEITDRIRPGVVSLPHGWGHDAAQTRTRVAAEHAGVNSNVLTDEAVFDPLSATSALNGIPVLISRG